MSEASFLAGLMARLEIGDEVLREPEWLAPADPWLGHAPFVFWLVRRLRPRVLVEWSGESCTSWFLLCQAIEADRLGTRAAALGGWTAAPRKLYRVTDVERWDEAHQARYAGFGTVAHRSVAAGRDLVADGSVDLLVVRAWPAEASAAWAQWRAALAPDGIVLMAPDRRGAALIDGVRFSFDHAGGLEAIAVGTVPAAVAPLFGLTGPEAGLVRRFFAGRGAAASTQAELQAERTRGRASATGFAAQVQALRRRQRTELETAYRDVSTWLERALHRYEAWRLRREEELRGEIEALKGALGRSELAREGAQDAVRSVMASTSWRVTRPLRLAASLGRASPAPAESADGAPETTQALERVVDRGTPPPVPPPRQERVAMPDLFALRSHVPASPVAVVLHIAEPAHAEAALAWLEQIEAPFDLFVTLVEDRSDHLLPMLGERLLGAPIFAFPDLGRDVLPFLALAGSGALFGYGLVCKLVADAAAPSIVADRAGVAAIVAGFGRDPDLGMVLAAEAARPVRPDAGWAQVLPALGLDALPEGVWSGACCWLRPFVLRDLLGVGITPAQFGTSEFADVVEGAIGVACVSAGLRVERGAASGGAAEAASGEAPRVIAFYLPQFHPIPQNDAWWGAGFTEWRNVTQATPSFAGHRQPRLPGELGFTDLRVAETRAAQAALAAAYGVSAFCYHFYWFGEGKRLLQRPLDEVLASGEPPFPFMICWANEPWSRRWDGGREDVLMAQDYAPGWEEDFASEILPLLQDRRYVRLDGRPVILIYRVMHLPSPALSLARIRERLAALGVGAVHVAAGWFSLPGDAALPDDPAAIGCDSYFEFPPHRLPQAPPEAAPEDFEGQIFDYARTVDRAIARLAERDDPAVHPGVMMGWDNTARRGRAAHVYRGATPCLFRRWLRAVVRHEQARDAGARRLVFVNAWNEWAEGTCLEPDRDFGRGWLEAVRSALGRG